MGFWHTGYMEHHEADFFRSLTLTPAVPAPPRFACPDCSRVFDSVQELESHRFNGHSSRRPVLLLRGLECTRSRLTVSQSTEASDWDPIDCQLVTVNGVALDPTQAVNALAGLSAGVAKIVLHGEHVSEEVDLRFAIAQPDDLDLVDDRLAEMVRRRTLSIAAIESFLAETGDAKSATDYRAGIAQYLYGVLARERASDSFLDYDAYRGRFDEAVALLAPFHRAPADAICGLVGFHYNQFDVATARCPETRLAAVADRLSTLISGGSVDVDQLEAGDPSDLVYVLSDRYTEQVVEWCSMDLTGGASNVCTEIERGLGDQDPMDQLKLRLVAVEHMLAAGDWTRARTVINELRHNAVTRDYARVRLVPH